MLDCERGILVAEMAIGPLSVAHQVCVSEIRVAYSESKEGPFPVSVGGEDALRSYELISYLSQLIVGGSFPGIKPFRFLFSFEPAAHVVSWEKSTSDWFVIFQG